MVVNNLPVSSKTSLSQYLRMAKASYGTAHLCCSQQLQDKISQCWCQRLQINRSDAIIAEAQTVNSTQERLHDKERSQWSLCSLLEQDCSQNKLFSKPILQDPSENDSLELFTKLALGPRTFLFPLRLKNGNRNALGCLSMTMTQNFKIGSSFF